MTTKHTPGISFSTTKADAILIAQIADRAAKISAANGWGQKYGALTAAMDITICHSNGCPLDLKGLLAANHFDFAHDMLGINRHMDRHTGKLTDCFSPRFALRAEGRK